VIASHLSDAYEAAGEDPDASELRARACGDYMVAAERAEAIGAPEAAEAAYLKAVKLSSDDFERASFTERAGQMAAGAGWLERAVDHFETAAAAHSGAGRVVDAARVIAGLGESLSALGRGELAITRIREALSSVDGTTPAPEVVADLQSTLGGILIFSGQRAEAYEAIEEALTLAQHHQLAEPLAFGLDSKATLFNFAGRTDEAAALYELSIAVARRHGIARVEMRSEANFADLCMTRDLPGAEEHAKAALALARRWGHRGTEAFAAGNVIYVLSITGRIDEAFQLGNELFEAGGDERPGAGDIHLKLAHLEALRGNVDAARQHLSMCGTESDDVQYRGVYASAEAAVLLAEADNIRALEVARAGIDEALAGGLGVAHEVVRIALPIALEAAIEIGDLEEADRLADLLVKRPAGEVPPFLRAQLMLAKALVARARGVDEDVEENLVGAEATFRELGYPHWTARTQLDRAEWLAGQGRFDESTRLTTEAAATFETSGVAPMLARARALLESELVRDPGADDVHVVATSRPLHSQ